MEFSAGSVHEFSRIDTDFTSTSFLGDLPGHGEWFELRGATNWRLLFLLRVRGPCGRWRSGQRGLRGEWRSWLPAEARAGSYTRRWSVRRRVQWELIRRLDRFPELGRATSASRKM